jgi:hypothetical protein
LLNEITHAAIFALFKRGGGAVVPAPTDGVAQKSAADVVMLWQQQSCSAEEHFAQQIELGAAI